MDPFYKTLIDKTEIFFFKIFQADKLFPMFEDLDHITGLRSIQAGDMNGIKKKGRLFLMKILSFFCQNISVQRIFYKP